MDVPPDAFVVGCVAAVKKHHKRIDCLIREFHQRTVGCPPTTAFLLIAGAKTDESSELVQLAETLIPGRFKILLDLPHDNMPDLYRAMDVFVLSSLFEMMPIAVLEALASGVPAITNDHPVMTWMTGAHDELPGGWAINMDKPGELCGLLTNLSCTDVAQRGANARERAMRTFAKEAVVRQYVGFYRVVVDEP